MPIFFEFLRSMWLLGGLLVHLQDSFVNEFIRFAFGVKNLETAEGKKKNFDYTATKEIISEVLTIACIAFFLITVASLLKYFKDGNKNSSDTSISDISMTESSEGSVYSLPLESTKSKINYVRHDCGDSVFIPRIDEIPTIDLCGPDSYDNYLNNIELNRRADVSIRSSELSTLSRRESPYNHRQITHQNSLQQIGQKRTSQMVKQQQAKFGQNQGRSFEREWLVRRTRSGHVYEISNRQVADQQHLGISSDDEDQQHRSSDIAKFDESIETRNPEDVPSPTSSKRPTNSRTRSKPELHDTNARSSASRATDFRRYSIPEDSFNKSMGLDSETSDSDDSEDVVVQKLARMKLADLYDSKLFDHLNVSSEVKELFQNITRYTPQKLELHYKLIPLIPDYIPAVGDIDAFLKVPRPDNAPDRLGLVVLDEPAADQSEPAVLHLQLCSLSRSAVGSSRASVVKRLEDASKQSKLIDKWIEDMSQLHRSKHPPTVQLTNRFPNPDVLLEPWPSEIEDKFNLLNPPNLLEMDCNLLQLVDIVCALLDIPVYENAKIESLHVLFALYTEIYNIDIQKIHM